MAEDGFNVAVNYAVIKEKAEAVVSEIKAKGVESFAIQANVAEGDEVKAMIKEVVSQFGSLDVLVNNAGITRDNLLMRMKNMNGMMLSILTLKVHLIAFKSYTSNASSTWWCNH